MEEDFYATIKFKSGEEIFAKVSYSEEADRTFLVLSTPIVIDKIKNRAGMQGFRVEPWLKTSKEEIFVINLDDVLTLSESDDLETISMHETFSKQHEQYYNQERKLNRKMGYISTISEAKESLEKLFKNN
jgi:hypothetical protein|tara:strand:- start:53 stop:442 length:390 start_codon:yes stop_codon:yes gene_type:complete